MEAWRNPRALLAAGGFARLWTQQQELENYGKEEASHA